MSPEYAAEWVRKAETDRRAAEVSLKLSRREKDLAEIACFHAQQCAEKYLKALLAQAGRAVPKVHDLPVLAKMAAAAGCILGLREESLHLLDSFAVEIRYPGATATAGEARQAVAAMNRVRRACRAALKPILKRPPSRRAGSP